MDGEEPHWQQFRGTELGGLLTSLYGRPTPEINYPKPKQKAFQPSGKFLGAGTKVGARDPRQATRRDVAIVIPKPTGGSQVQRPAAVDCIARRRQADTIKAELDDIAMRISHYRPANTRAVDEREKERFAQICTYKGGKALPEGLVLPVGDAPFELAQKRAEQERLAKVRAKRFPNSVPISHPTQPLTPSEQLKEQIAAEINERREHLAEMRELGIKPQDERRIKQEIASRVSELERLEREG
jgi:Uncharacterised protein family (UPF0193)